MNCTFSVGESYGALAKFQHYPKLLIEGPRGTSKSRSILGFLLSLLFQYPGARLMICRRFRAELTKTILTTLEDEVFPDFGIPVPGGAHRSGRSEYLLPNGSVIWPAGIDDGMGVLSMGITFAYCAEIIEMDEETVTDIAGGLRWLQSKERPQLPETSLLIMDTNPGAPAHWANQKAETIDSALRTVRTKDDYLRLQEHNYRPAADPVNRWKRIVTKHQDNPGYWDHDAWDYTPLGRSYVTQQLEGFSGYKRARWLHGLWKAAEGAVYREFDEDVHVREPFDIPREWPSWLAEDPGYDHPTVILLMTMAPNGRLYVVNEYVKRETSIEDDAKHITQNIDPNFSVRKKLGDPHYMFSKTKHGGGKTIAMQMATQGHRFEPAPAARNQIEIAQQVEMVRTLLKTIGADGAPMLQVFNTCQNTIRGFQSWSYVRDTSGNMTGGEDRFEDVEDDEMDCVRMIIASGPKHAQLRSRILGGRRE
jgi:hypothetical protein